MKLDRNTRPDGLGKYALIQLRKITDEDLTELLEARRDKRAFALDSDCLTLGDETGERHFVLKYKDQFVAPALEAYAKAVREYANNLPEEDSRYGELIEYADAVAEEARIAKRYNPSKLPD